MGRKPRVDRSPEEKRQIVQEGHSPLRFSPVRGPATHRGTRSGFSSRGLTKP